MGNGQPERTPSSTATGPLPGAGYTLALLLAINLFNYIDRQILSATLPKIKLDASILRPDDPWIQTKLGLLTTAFMVSYMLLSPLFGWLGDKAWRWKLVGIGVVLWSLATGGTGLATGYLVLLLTRCFVGVGEAAYGPVAPSMLSDLYPVDHRGRVMAWFYVAIPVGSALGFVIGGLIADTSLGWRGAFLVAVVPGILLGAICFFMREPPRAQQPSTAEASHSSGYIAVLRELIRNRSFVLCCTGMTASTFVLGGVAAWVPTYIFEREARFTVSDNSLKALSDLKQSNGEPVVPPELVDRLRSLIGPERMTIAQFREKLDGKGDPVVDKGSSGPKGVLTEAEFKQYGSWIYDAAPADGSLRNGDIGLYFGAILVVGGLAATLLGGMLGDWLRNRGVRGAYFHVAGWGALAGFPCFLALIYLPFPYAWGAIFFTIFFLFINTGPANTVLANVSRAQIRATAFAINILVIHALGDAISPTLIGGVADLTNLHTAFRLTSFFILVAGVLWIAGARYLDEDTRKAHDAELNGK